MANILLAQDIAELEALRNQVTDDHLHEDGRYFRDGYSDLTQCTHGETGNFRNRRDGRAIALLWNLWKDGVLRPIASATTSKGCADE